MRKAATVLSGGFKIKLTCGVSDGVNHCRWRDDLDFVRTIFQVAGDINNRLLYIEWRYLSSIDKDSDRIKYLPCKIKERTGG